MGELIRHRRSRCFVLLEVMVAIVLIGTTMVALIRGFLISLDTIKKIKMNEQAILLAESLIDDLALEPPAEGSYSGYFSDDIRFGETMKDWKWEVEVVADEPDYQERPAGKLMQDMERYYTARIDIYHEDDPDGGSSRNTESTRYIQAWTILIEADVFSSDSLEANQLF